tara:strand:- start:1132 stop:1773 length:642 start_codon:yes stop_codon:yes gene_type:complete
MAETSVDLKPKHGVSEPNVVPQQSDDAAKMAPSQHAKKSWWPQNAVELTQFIANLAVIAALAFTAVTFWKQQQEAKRQESAQFVSNLYSERLATARSILFRLWADKDLAVFEKGVPSEFKEALVRKTIETSPVPQTDIVEAIVTLTNYYDEVEFCVANLRCDLAEIDENLGRYGVSFYCLYRTEIVSLRSKLALPSLGEGLAQFAQRQGGCPR